MSKTPEWHTYKKSYDPQTIQGDIEEARPWQLLQVIRSYIPENARLLDVGCGPGTKLPSLAPFSSGIIGVDTVYGLVFKAKVLVDESKMVHIEFANADGNRLPFPSGSFDIVTHMLSPHNANEAYRVLRPGGVVIMERVGEQDKWELKEFFGSDEQGPRGYRMEYKKGQLANEYKADFEKAGFSEVSVLDGMFYSWYTRDRLERLIKEAPTIRNFDPVADREILDRVEQELGTPQGIRLQQHRILLVAKK